MSKSSKNSFELHKEKERLRHRKQVRIFDRVLGMIPSLPNESHTRVQKIRHLVAYYHFLKNVNTELTKQTNFSSDCNKPIKKRAMKLHYETIKTHAVRRKYHGANIVFLKVDKSEGEKADLRELVQESLMTDCMENNENSDCHVSFPAASPECIVPEAEVVDGMCNTSFFDQDITCPQQHLQAQIYTDESNSSKECQVSTVSVDKNHSDVYADLASDIYPEELFCFAKHNCSPVTESNSDMDHNIENIDESNAPQFSKRKSDKNLTIRKHKKIGFPESTLGISNDFKTVLEESISQEKENYPPVVTDDSAVYSDEEIGEKSFVAEKERSSRDIADKNALFGKRMIHFQNITQDNSDYFKKGIVPAGVDKCPGTAMENSAPESAGYLYKVYPIENVYPVRLSNGRNQNFPLPSFGTFGKFYFCSDPASSEPRVCNRHMTECSNNGSILPDNLYMDVDHVSDSSNEHPASYVNSVSSVTKDGVFNGPQAPFHDVLDSLSYEEVTNDCTLPIFSSPRDYPGDNFVRNGLSDNASHFYIGPIHPNTVIHGYDRSAVHSKSHHLIDESGFASDCESFYSQNADVNEMSLLTVKQEVMDSDSYINSSPESNSMLHPKVELFEPDSCLGSSQERKPVFFEEEASYPLAQFISDF